MMGLSGTYASARSGVLPLEDIAVGLSRANRFGGQYVVPWTVADHLLAGVEFLSAYSESTRLHFALHDAHEAMTMDVPTSFKTWGVRRLQRKLDRRLYKSLGLKLPSLPVANLVKDIDKIMLVAEARVVTPTATYERIVQETGGMPASHRAMKAVGKVLSRNAASDALAEEWLKTVKELMNAAR